MPYLMRPTPIPFHLYKTISCLLLLLYGSNYITTAQPDTVWVQYEVKNIPNFTHINFYGAHESDLPNGQFSLIVEEPTFIMAVLNKDRQQRNTFLIDTNLDTLFLSIDGSENIHIAHSKLNRDYFFFNRIRKGIDSLISPSITAMREAAASEEDIAAFESDYYKSYYEIEYQFCLQNPSSFICLRNLNWYIKTRTIPNEKTKKLFNALHPSLHQYPTYKLCAAAIKNIDDIAYQVGDTLKSCLFDDENSQSKDLKTLLPKGKLSYIDFWGSCSASRTAHKPLSELYAQNKNKLAIISITYENDYNWWKDASQEDNIKWVNLRSDLGDLHPIFHLLGINNFPKGVLINDQGVILELDLHPDHLPQILEKYLKKTK
jgi:hypothetical protein